MRRRAFFASLCVLCAVALGVAAFARVPANSMPDVPAAELPQEARDTLALIRKGGPFPYRRDATVFRNFEQRLPVKGRGYYREYTVPTPGAPERGAGAPRLRGDATAEARGAPAEKSGALSPAPGSHLRSPSAGTAPPSAGARDRGARRIVAGAGADGDVRTSGEYYYTDDHYSTFHRIRE
jgi:ribonuclease T1